MPEFSLDSIRKVADEKYGPFVIPMGGDDAPVTLLPYLRLSSEKRKAWDGRQSATTEATDDNPADVADYFRDMVRIIAKSDDDADRLLDAIGDDAAALSVVLREYGERTSQGEATPSQG